MADRLHVRHGSVFAYVHEPRERRAAGATEGNSRERGSTRISRSSRNRARRPPQARLIYEWDQTPEEVDGADWPSSVPLWCSDRPIVRWSLLSSFRLSLSFSSSLSLSLFFALFSASLSLPCSLVSSLPSYLDTTDATSCPFFGFFLFSCAAFVSPRRRRRYSTLVAACVLPSRDPRNLPPRPIMRRRDRR